MSDQAPFIVIGERINATRKDIRAAVRRRDADAIIIEARKQAEAGAHYIDLNAGAKPETEADDLQWMVTVVQSALDLPLCLDSANPEVLKGALTSVKKAPIINSVTAEPQRLAAILPLVLAFGTDVVGLCMLESGMPQGVAERLAAAEQIVRRAEAAGVPLSRLHLDPVICPAATSPAEAMAGLEAVRRLKAAFPQARTTCGLSNVSFGLPNRNVLNRAYLAMMLGAGLDSAIMDPTEPGMSSLIAAAAVLLARDEYCLRYIEAARQGQLT